MSKSGRFDSGMSDEEYERVVSRLAGDKHVVARKLMARNAFEHFRDFARSDALGDFAVLEGIASPDGMVDISMLRALPVEERLATVDLLVRHAHRSAVQGSSDAVSESEQRRQAAFWDRGEFARDRVRRLSRKENKTAVRNALVSALSGRLGKVARSAGGVMEVAVQSGPWRVITTLDFGGNVDVELSQAIKEPDEQVALWGGSMCLSSGVILGDRWRGVTEEEAPGVAERITRGCELFIEIAGRLPIVGVARTSDPMR
jgi:hypothetical protein